MKQESGNFSNNIQAGGNINVGVSYSDARQIALDVFKANFCELSANAAQKALERAEAITETFVKRFFKEIPHLAEKLEEPSIQYSIFSAQKEFAKTGDIDLEARLLDILTERIKSEERSLTQIVLDEALTVIPKLTNAQVDILSLILSMINLTHADVNNLSLLTHFLNTRILQFYQSNDYKASFFTHLQFSGCCSIVPSGASWKPFEEIFRNKFKGLFAKGFSESDFNNEINDEIGKYSTLLTVSLRNPSALQFNAIDDDVINKKIDFVEGDDVKMKLKNLWEKNTMSIDEVKEEFININPLAEQFMNHWKEFNTLRLTSVGNAIAVFNYNKRTGEKLTLEELI